MTETKQLAAAMAPVSEAPAKPKKGMKQPLVVSDISMSAPGLTTQIGRAELYILMDVSQRQTHALQLRSDSFAREVSKILSKSD